MVGFCEFLSSAKHFADEVVTAFSLKSGQFGAKQALKPAHPSMSGSARARHDIFWLIFLEMENMSSRWDWVGDDGRLQILCADPMPFWQTRSGLHSPQLFFQIP